MSFFEYRENEFFMQRDSSFREVAECLLLLLPLADGNRLEWSC